MSKRYDLFLKATKNDVGVSRFLETIYEAISLWDDLHDKDKALTDNTVDKVFWQLLIELPRNTFYMQNFVVLNSAIVTMIHDWHVANDMEETESDHDKTIAFVIRGSYTNLIMLCAFIVGGYEWLREISPEIHRFAHSETIEEYKQSLQNKRENRSKS